MRLNFVTEFLPVDKYSNVFRSTKVIPQFKNIKYLFILQSLPQFHESGR